jgi:hypothetical protein
VRESGAAHDFSPFNLVGLHVLAALRGEHHLHMAKTRAAIDYLRERLGSPRPLIDDETATNGSDIFVSKLGSLIDVSQHGQPQ